MNENEIHLQQQVEQLRHTSENESYLQVEVRELKQQLYEETKRRKKAEEGYTHSTDTRDCS